MRPLFLITLLLAAAARLAWGQAAPCTPGQPASPDGDLCLAETAIGSGGDRMKDTNHPSLDTTDGLTLVSAMGKFGTAMAGGAFQLWPGVVASVRVAASDTSAAHAFPTPFIPSQGHTKITFTELPSEVTIKIYTLSGRLVKTFVKSDLLNSLVWSPVANEQGSALASGVYIFIISQPGTGQKKGKIMIIR